MRAPLWIVCLGIATCAAALAGATRVAAAGPPVAAPVKEALAAARATPRFAAPGPAFDASKARGKLIFNIPVASYLPFVVNVGKAMKRIAVAHGLKFVDYPNQGQPSQWVAGIQQAINQHADLIVLNTGADPKLVGPQLRQAQQAGIPVLVTHMYPAGAALPPGVTASIPAPFAAVGRLLADGAIAYAGGSANTFMVLDDEYEASRVMHAAAAAEMRRFCPSCKLSSRSVNVTDWATKIQPTVQTALLDNPKLNFILPIFDAMQQFTLAGVTASNATGRIHTGSYNGDPAVLKLIAKGSPALFTIGESADQLAYANEALRILSGVPPVKNVKTPLRLFDRTNVAQTGSPPAWSKGYGTDYVAGYERLWRG